MTTDIYRTFSVNCSFYNKIATTSPVDILEWLSVRMCASSVALKIQTSCKDGVMTV
jgi:hypothetical protein